VDYPVVYVPISGKADAIGEKLAKCVEKQMGTKQKGYAKKRKGSGEWDYYGVIYGAVSVGVPGIIIEHSFHTNTRSTNWLLNDANLAKMAKAEAEVIASHYGLKKKDEPATGKWYRVQIGAYQYEENAKKTLEKAKAAGFTDAYIKYD
jgi:hypothetical protein